MTTLMTRLALAALFALPLAGAGATLPAVANDPIDFVCYDVEQPDGSTEVECEPAGLVAAECEKTDPDSTNPVCKAAEDAAFRPQREWMTPVSLTEGGDNGGGGTPAGGGFNSKPRPMMERN
jgi:hypothetical protein